MVEQQNDPKVKKKKSQYVFCFMEKYFNPFSIYLFNFFLFYLFFTFKKILYLYPQDFSFFRLKTKTRKLHLLLSSFLLQKLLLRICFSLYRYLYIYFLFFSSFTNFLFQHLFFIKK